MINKGLKINNTSSQISAPLANEKDDGKQIIELYDKVDMFFGNLDYANLNYETARMLDLSGEEYIGSGKSRGGKNDRDEDELIQYSYVMPIETTMGNYAGACIESGCGNERRVFGYLKALPDRRGNGDTFVFPHAFDKHPQVFCSTVSGAQAQHIRFYYEEILHKPAGDIPEAFHFVVTNKYTEAALSKSRFSISAEPGSDYVTEKELVFWVVGEGSFKITTQFVREDFNPFNAEG